MFGNRGIKLDRSILARARQRAIELGYASVQEYLTHLIERDTAQNEPSADERQTIMDKLKGMGYLE